MKMLAMAIEECLGSFDHVDPSAVPLLLCVAELGRPGRLDRLDEDLFPELERELAIRFHPTFSGVVALGRVGSAVALAQARKLVDEHGVRHVLVAAGDSLLVGPTLAELDIEGRLLTSRNSDGFVPGEAAGAFMVSADPGPGAQLFCRGVGFAEELAGPRSEQPLRAEGLSLAIKAALADSGCAMDDLDFRITDNSGEQYYFKETALAQTRLLRKRKEAFDIWHPADCIGEVGAAIGAAMISVALISCRKGYGLGPNILLHIGNDAGRRVAIVLRYQEHA